MARFPGDEFEQIRRVAEQFQRLQEVAAPLSSAMRQVDLLGNIAVDALQRVDGLRISLPDLPTVSLDLQRALQTDPLISDQVTQSFAELEEAVRRSSLSFHFETGTLDSLTRTLALMGPAGIIVQERLLEIDEAETPSEANSYLLDLIHALTEWIRGLPQSATSRMIARAVVNIVLPVGLFVFGYVEDLERYQGQQKERAADLQWQRRLERQIADMADAIENLARAPADRRFYRVVNEDRPIRATPEAKARTLLHIPTGNMFEELEQKGQWLYVLYLPPEGGPFVVGWAYRRNLEVVNLVEKPDSLGTDQR